MNFKVTNTNSGVSIVTDTAGFEGLIASHTHKMEPFLGAIEAALIRDAVQTSFWESTQRGMRIEQTSLPVNLKPVEASVC